MREFVVYTKCNYFLLAYFCKRSLPKTVWVLKCVYVKLGYYFSILRVDALTHFYGVLSARQLPYLKLVWGELERVGFSTFALPLGLPKDTRIIRCNWKVTVFWIPLFKYKSQKIKAMLPLIEKPTDKKRKKCKPFLF